MARANPKQRQVDEKNFYQLGELLIVNIRKFGGSAQITDEMAEQLYKDDADVLRGVQDLMLPEHRDTLKALDTLKNEVLGYVGRNSVPHPLPAFYFIYKSEKQGMEEYLKRKQEEYKELAQFFADNFGQYEEEFKKAKPKLYREDKYPSKAMLLSRFDFSWKWVEIMPADPNSDDLKQDLAQMKNYVLLAMKKTIADRMDALQRMCNGDGKITQATIDSIESNIFDKYDRLFAGFIDSVDIEKAIADLKEYLEGTDADMLRSDEEFKAMVAAKAKEVAGSIEKIEGGKTSDRMLLF